MRERLSTRKLFGKFMLVQMPVFAIALALGLATLMAVYSRDELNRLNARVGNLTARVGTLISQSHVQADPSQMEAYVGLLLADPAIRCAEVTAPGTIKAVAPRKIGCKGQDAYNLLKLPIQGTGNLSLAVRYSDAEVATANEDKQKFNYLAILISLLVATLASWFAFRLIIGRPMTGLLSAIRRSAADGVPEHVTEAPSDELGTVINAYNAMQSRLAEEAQSNLQSLSRLQHIYQETPGLMFSMCAHGHITNASGHWLDTMGYDRSEVLGKPLSHFIRRHEDQAPVEFASLLGSDIHDLPLALTTKSGVTIEVLLSAALHPDPTGDHNDYLCVLNDVTSLNAASRKLHQQAVTDHLTGLPNRTGLFEHFETLRREAAGDISGLTLLFIDLDNFKWVNDTHGHGVGDILLREASARLRDGIGSGDYLACLGGDEFAVILRKPASLDEATKVAEQLIASLVHPFEIGERTVHLGCSIGLAGPFAKRSGLAEMMRLADLAMYRSKQEGRGRVTVYANELEIAASRIASGVARVRSALQLNELRLHYQPIMCLDRMQPCGAEALLRIGGDGPPVSPAEFIAAAEESGLIRQVGGFVIDAGLAACQKFAVQDDMLNYVAVNLSPRQIDSAFAADLLRKLRDRPQVAKHLVFEITETALLNHNDRIASFFEEIRSLGARIALDDFGTGYSSLSHLARYPIDAIKLDRSFIRHIDDPHAPGVRRNRALVRAASTLCREIGISVVAEGLETVDEIEAVRDLGISFGQGYAFSRALPEAELRQWVEAFGQRKAQPLSIAV